MFKKKILVTLAIGSMLCSSVAFAIVSSVSGSADIQTDSDPVSFKETVNSIKNSEIGKSMSGTVGDISSSIGNIGAGSVTDTISGYTGGMGSSVISGGSLAGGLKSNPISPISSLGTSKSSYVDVGTRVVGAYCSTVSESMSTARGVSRSFSTLEGAIGSQIANATSQLSNVIQENIAKASIANTKSLKGQADQEKSLHENRMAYDEQQEKALQLTAAKAKIAEDLDVSKLNTTNACQAAGQALRHLSGNKSAKAIATSATQMARNYNRGLKKTADIEQAYNEVVLRPDGTKPLDDLLPATNSDPKVLTPEQANLQMKANAVMANPSPSPEIDPENKSLANSPAGQRYAVAKELLDKKSEAVAYVLNKKTSTEAALIEAPMDNDFVYNELDEKHDSGMKDKDGKPIMTSNIDDNNKTSSSALLAAEVHQYHSNPDWQNNMISAGLSTKVGELLKVSALNLDLNYKIYKELVIANQLKAYSMQKEISKDGQSLQRAFESIQE